MSGLMLPQWCCGELRCSGTWNCVDCSFEM